MAMKRVTLRLSEKENECIEELKKIIPEKTNNGIIAHVIRNYKELFENYQEEKQAKNKLEKRVKETNEDLKTLFETLNKLNPLD